ncbi:hypothetical protein CDIK_2346 [Cucumispora dikerogammari]|nr:hypothetical protein CDIK_2346 [Cucumispora dikerogammari]
MKVLDSLEYGSIKLRLRKLFFTDFISFSYEFFLKTRSQVKVYQIEKCCFNKDTIREIFMGLIPTKEFADLNGIDIDFLETIYKQDIDFTFLLNKLEEMVKEHTGLETNTVRKILYLNKDFSFDINDVQAIRDFYHIITYFLSLYGLEKYSRDSEAFSLLFSRNNVPRFRIDCPRVIKELIKNYQDYLIIDVESEFEASNRPETDPRFIKYIENRELLTVCCIRKNTNLISIDCNEHKDIIEEIRKNYCENINCDFKTPNSFFNGFLSVEIGQVFRVYYKPWMITTDTSRQKKL